MGKKLFGRLEINLLHGGAGRNEQAEAWLAVYEICAAQGKHCPVVELHRFKAFSGKRLRVGHVADKFDDGGFFSGAQDVERSREEFHDGKHCFLTGVSPAIENAYSHG